MQKYRGILFLFVFLYLIYLIAGVVVVQLGYFQMNSYLTVAGIAGGAASVIGMLSLAQPALSKSDLQELEFDTLKKIAKASDELSQAEQEKTSTQAEIARLEKQRREIDLLVRKASLSLIYQEQFADTQKRILDHIGRNQEFQNLLDKHKDLSTKLTTLDEEIEQDENEELIREIIKLASANSKTRDEKETITDPLVLASRNIINVVETMMNIVQRFF
jgi:hypothetical protein